MNIVARSDVLVRLQGLRRRPGPDRRAWIIRPDDLLVLDFELVKLVVQPGEGETPARLAKSGTGQAYLIVTFPPQHLAEIAYFTTVPAYPVDKGPAEDDPDKASAAEPPDAPPVQAIVAGWSRLVFRVPDDRLPIDWTLPSLLEAMRTLELSVPVNALPPVPKRVISAAVGGIVEVATVGKFAFATDASGAQVAGAQRAVSALRPGAAVIAASRARRQLRVGARALGLTEASGSATIGLHEAIVDSVAEAGVPPYLRTDLVPGDPNAATSPLDFVRERVVYADAFEL
jgi:hypothetical protein